MASRREKRFGKFQMKVRKGMHRARHKSIHRGGDFVWNEGRTFGYQKRAPAFYGLILFKNGQKGCFGPNTVQQRSLCKKSRQKHSKNRRRTSDGKGAGADMTDAKQKTLKKAARSSGPIYKSLGG